MSYQPNSAPPPNGTLKRPLEEEKQAASNYDVNKKHDPGYYSTYYGSPSAPPPPSYSQYPPPPPHQQSPPPPSPYNDYRSSQPPPPGPYGQPPPPLPQGQQQPPPLNDNRYGPPPPQGQQGQPPPPPPYYDNRSSQPPPPPPQHDNRYGPPPPQGQQPPPPPPNDNRYGPPPPPPGQQPPPYYDTRGQPPPYYDNRPPPPPYGHYPPPPSHYPPYYGGYDYYGYSQPPPPPYYDNRGPPPPPYGHYGSYPPPPPPHYPPYDSNYPPPPQGPPGQPPPPPLNDNRYGPPPPQGQQQQLPPQDYNRGPPPPQQQPPQQPSSTSSTPPKPSSFESRDEREEREEREHRLKSQNREELAMERKNESDREYSNLRDSHNSHNNSYNSSSHHRYSGGGNDRYSVNTSNYDINNNNHYSNSSAGSQRNDLSSSLNTIQVVPKVRDDQVKPTVETKKAVTYSHSKPIRLATNHFMCQINTHRLYLNSISFSPNIDNPETRHAVLNEFKKEIGPYQFDSQSLIYTKNKIPSNTYTANNGTKITINFVKELSEDDKTLTQFYNVYLKKMMRLLDFSILGRQYYNSKLKSRIEEFDLEIWPGFFTSINHISQGVSLLADVSHKIVRTQSVYQFINQRSRNGLNEKAIMAQLEGKIVITRYNNKTYRVNSIDWNRTPMDKFETADGSISFEEYYRKNYPQHSIKEKNQPMITTEVKRRGQKELIYLVPELCFITGIDDDMRVNHSMMLQISRKINVDPNTRFKRLREFVTSLKSDPKVIKESQDWGINFASAMEVDGALFEETRPQYRNQQKPLDGMNWVMLVSREDYRSALPFIDELCSMSRLAKPEIIELDRPVPTTYTDAIEKNLTKYKDRSPPAFYFCVIPSKNDFYNRIKRHSFVVSKVITQCALVRTLNKTGKGQVTSKIVNQLTAKAGFAPWGIRMQDQLVPEHTMVIGIDIGHNTDQKAKSVVAICATINKDYTKFFSVAILQSVSGKEIIDSLKSPIMDALKAYHKHNGVLPKTVIIYRDGVGDGMLAAVHKVEVSSVREAFNDLPQSLGDKPSLIYIIVKKNTNTRFFSMDNNYGNPMSGTVISQGCTHSDWYDFYLISQKSSQGTINPCHFNVINDDTNISQEALQQFTYNLCYLYFNFDQAVRVPAPIQYSKKLAYMVGKSVHAPAAEEMSLKLYYL